MDQKEGFFILDTDAERLAVAPGYEQDSVGENKAEEIYRYFGQYPFWKAEEEEYPPKLQYPIPLPEF